jgi:alkylation response protein AidB-like acyl-CoA dehydrogenase
MTVATVTERAELVEMAREFARRELTPRVVALDAGDPAVIAGCWRQLVELGLDRALLEEEHGGAGLGILDLLAAIEELAVGDGGIALCVLLCNAALATLAPEPLASIPEGARWVLVPVRAGTEVTISNGQLDGRIACALGAHEADGLVLVGPRSTPIGISAATPGLEVQYDETQMGLRAAPAASILLAGVIAQSDMAATDGAESLALLRTGTAAIARGIARRAYEMALEYAQARHQGGVAIVEHDAVSDMLAAMAVRLAVPLPTATGETQALAAKIAQTDAAVTTTIDAVQVFGGTGYMRETGIEKLMRDAKYCQLFPEPNWVAQDELMCLERRRKAIR